jgi:hypothetical protein
MKLRVIVEVIDERTHKGTRRRREVEVPGRVLNAHKVLCESRRDLRAFVADDVMSGALAAISGQRGTTEALDSALLSEPAPAPVRVNSQAPTKRSHNKVESFLGLDVIEHMDSIDHHANAMEKAQENQAAAAGHPPPPKFEWGPIGYGPDRGR